MAANSDRSKAANNSRQHHRGGDWVVEGVAAEVVAEGVVGSMLGKTTC